MSTLPVEVTVNVDMLGRGKLVARVARQKVSFRFAPQMAASVLIDELRRVSAQLEEHVREHEDARRRGTLS